MQMNINDIYHITTILFFVYIATISLTKFLKEKQFCFLFVAKCHSYCFLFIAKCYCFLFIAKCHSYYFLFITKYFCFLSKAKSLGTPFSLTLLTSPKFPQQDLSTYTQFLQKYSGP